MQRSKAKSGTITVPRSSMSSACSDTNLSSDSRTGVTLIRKLVRHLARNQLLAWFEAASH